MVLAEPSRHVAADSRTALPIVSRGCRLYTFLTIAMVLAAAGCILLWTAMRRRNIDGWFRGYIKWALRKSPASRATRHVLFCFVDLTEDTVDF